MVPSVLLVTLKVRIYLFIYIKYLLTVSIGIFAFADPRVVGKDVIVANGLDYSVVQVSKPNNTIPNPVAPVVGTPSGTFSFTENICCFPLSCNTLTYATFLPIQRASNSFRNDTDNCELSTRRPPIISSQLTCPSTFEYVHLLNYRIRLMLLKHPRRQLCAFPAEVSLQ